nr:RNA-directed DNA polymerase, eukaryota, reverse transcriptase zinc-binding domain protein [Tanacetum cinerariifolium]
MCYVNFEAIKGSLSMYCTIVYAANGGNERINLWKELNLYKRIVRIDAWAIMGDMNFTLDPKEHSAGSSSMTRDMIDFKECVNMIGMDDIASSWNQIIRINAVHDEEGRRYEGDKVGDQFVNHFKQLLGESYPMSKIQDMEDLLKVKLNEEEAGFMIRDEIIGGYFCQDVKDIFHTGRILTEINSTTIALVPKTLTPTKLLYGLSSCSFGLKISYFFIIFSQLFSWSTF